MHIVLDNLVIQIAVEPALTRLHRAITGSPLALAWVDACRLGELSRRVMPHC